MGARRFVHIRAIGYRGASNRLELGRRRDAPCGRSTPHVTWIALVFALFAFSCGKRSSTPELDHLADGTPSLSHRSLSPRMLQGRLLTADPIIGDPRHMIVQGEELWIADNSGDPYLHVVNVRTGQIVFSRGRHGEGPGDFGESAQLSRRPGDDSAIWAYDARLLRLTRESTDPSVKYITFRTPQELVNIWSYGWISHTRLVGVGDMDTNRLIFADTAANLLSLVRAELLGADSISLEARRAASSGFVACAVPTAGRMAVLFQLAGRIDIHDSVGRFVGHANVPFPSNGEWAINRRRLLWAQPNWFYYLDCDGSSKYLYALFAGHRTDGPGGGKTRAGRYVHIFDWDGNLVGVIGLDHEMSTIAVSGDTSLYATGRETQGVYVYQLWASEGEITEKSPTARRAPSRHANTVAPR